MATFKIPESPTFNYLDLNNLQGMDSWDTNPNIMRSADMLNIVKKEGLHQVRHNITQSFMAGTYGEIQENDDQLYAIKYVGKIEEYDENGNTVPYYIKISEYLGEYQVEGDSRMCVSIWPTPEVKNVQYDMSKMEGFENYRISYQFIPFTNYGQSGNRQGLYEHINFDGKERVFTPIGILSFKCETQKIVDNGNELFQLDFTIENVLDNPYIPTIIYGSTPDGLDFTKYESINLLTNIRRAQFLGDGTSDSYQLPEKILDGNYCKVKILQSDGTYTELTKGTDFNINGSTGIVTFTNPPTVSPIEGKDNVIIEYKKNDSEETTEDTAFDMSCIAGNEILECDVNIVKEEVQDDSSKVHLQAELHFHVGNNFDAQIYSLTKVKLNIVHPGSRTSEIPTTNSHWTALTQNNLDSLNGGSQVDYTVDFLNVYKSSIPDNFIWQTTLKIEYEKSEGGSTSTIVPGSVASKITSSTTNYKSNQFSWMGFRISAEAEGVVGNKPDGSDSYWTITEKVQLWLNKASALNCRAGTLYGIIDGKETKLGSTGNMFATSTKYPSSPIVLTKKINYEQNKNNVSLSARMSFYAKISGTVYTNLTMSAFNLGLPTITLPQEVETSKNILLTGQDIDTFSEKEPDNKIIYANVVPGSAKLGCYYGAKCVTVYGYESDRRVFVSDGTNKDTFSGVTLDGKSSIYYFPDDNYNVLGEDTEILGYAQKNGYLLTFKRGEDSVYVRYGTTINNETVFPSSAVTRNLQVLSRPIQINDEILVITRSGIKSINYISNEVRAELRSYFINNYFELSADYNYDKMAWYIEDTLLHIFLDKYEFTADLVSKSYVREGASFGGTSSSSTLDFQYEWYVSTYDWLDGRQAPQITVYQPKDFERQLEGVKFDAQKAIGYSLNGIYQFSYSDYKVDHLLKIENDKVVDYYIPIKAHYITPFLNMGVINVAKTIKYVYINTRSKTGDMFAVGYIDENGMTETMEKVYTNVDDHTVKHKNSMIPFPKLIQIKSKIRKFMNVKLYIQNRAELNDTTYVNENHIADYGNITFDRILIQYQISGKYRGE